MIYKTVLGPKQIIALDKADAWPSLAGFEDLLNKYAAEGWTYHSMELVCAKFTEGKKLISAGFAENYWMLIFYRQ